MYFYFIIAFQGFCIYHLIKNRKPFFWIFAIIFLPLVGCIAYVITQVFRKNDAEKIKGNITTVIDPSKNIRNLESKLQFTDTYQNRVNLADAYLAAHNFKLAIKHYLKALEDKTQNDFYLMKSLISAYYYDHNYDEVIRLSQNLETHNEFENGTIPFMYGMALAQKGEMAQAEIHLRKMDKPYSNYNERLALVRFLLKVDKTDDAKTVLADLYEDTQNLTPMNQRIYRTTIAEIQKLKNTL